MKNNNYYIFGITLVATLGGLLFGYDTAVISGTVESLRKFFIEPFGLPLDQANALEGFVVSSALIGCILGASFAGCPAAATILICIFLCATGLSGE